MAAAHLADLDRLLEVAQALGRSGVDGPSAICWPPVSWPGPTSPCCTSPMPDGRRLVVKARPAGPIHRCTSSWTRSARWPARSCARRSAAFIGDLDADPRIDRASPAQVGAAAAFFQPIAIDDRPVGVLVAYWLAPVRRCPSAR